MLTVEEMAEKVRHMRELQRLYFATRSQHRLKQSIAAEREVDRAISEVLGPLADKPIEVTPPYPPHEVG